MTAEATTGRVNQKRRTREAILRAAAELLGTGREVSMPEIASAALVSEATAYRYFPDLASLLRETVAWQLPNPAEALKAVAESRDPAERIAAATEALLHHVLTYQGAVRGMIAATVIRPQQVTARPGLRFALIDYALAPFTDLDPDRRTQLERDLAVVVSAEAFFVLMDLCQLDPDSAIASLTRTATTLTQAAFAH